MSEPRKIEDAEGELSSIHDLIEDIYNGWDRLVNASTPGAHAHALVSLDSTMGDLITWHPRWNSNTHSIDPSECDEA